MKLKYKGKSYCVSQCAKDKFQTYLLNPISVITIAIFLGITILLILSLTGLIIEGVAVTFFNSRAFINLGVWILVGLGFYIYLLILFMLGSLALEAYHWLKRWLLNLYAVVHSKIDGTYEQKFKRNCTMFVECN